MSALTKMQYTACPLCGSTNITGKQFNADVRIAWQRIGCMTCHAEWEETFQFVCSDNLTDSNGDEKQFPNILRVTA